MKIDPILDIIMLVHDAAEWADLAIRAVEHQTKVPYRLIIIDSASKESKTTEVLEAALKRGHLVHRLHENRSFSNGVNVGVSLGSSKFICILNDDAMVTEGWDAALIQDLADKHTGMVGARSNYAAGAQGDLSFTGEPPYLVFVCVGITRKVWDVVGQMDEVTFDGFSSEDLDYSWRVKKAGYKLKLSSAYVLHAGSRTLIKTQGTTEGLTRNNEKYNQRLIEKWGKDWIKDHSSTKGRGLVVSYHAEEWTRVTFMGHLMGLRKDDGVGFSYFHMTRAPIHAARQTMCDYALDKGFDWLVQFDDDATFPPDVLKRLLSHQKDVVCALAYQRKPPYFTCAFEQGEDGLMGQPMEGIEHTGLRRVDVSGFHCSVLRTSVIKKLRDGIKDSDGKVLVPGTRQYFGGFENKLGEDFAFCINLKKIGVPVYCDTELIAGHIGAATVVDETYKQLNKAGRAP